MSIRSRSLMAFLALCAIALLAPASHAQKVLISNLNQFYNNASGGSGVSLAQGFTTDASSAGLYQIKIGSTVGAPSATVQLWSDSSDLPGSPLTDLNYIGVSGTVYSYTPGTPLTLNANTIYWIVQSVSPHWDIANSLTHSGPGSFPTPTYTASSFDNNNQWRPQVFDASPFLFEVQTVSTVPEPGAVALIVSLGLTGVTLLRRRTR